MRLRFVVPEQTGISGGRVVNTQLAGALRDRGDEVTELRLAGSWPWPAPEARAAVAAELTSPADAVVVDGLVGSACPDEIAAAVAAGRRVILLIHLPLPAEIGLTAAEQARLAESEARAVGAASAVVTTSRWAADDLLRRYGRAVSGVVVPGATPAPVAAGSEPPLLVMVATFTPVKNHATLLPALDLVSDLPWQAQLVGAQRDEEVMRGVRRALRAPGLVGRVRLPGELRGAELERVWHAADLLLLPSLTETYGLVVTEALAHGIPAVVPRGTGAVEALAGVPAAGPVTDLAGAVADPGDPAEWAEILRGWLTDRVRRDRWRARALERRAGLRSWADSAADLVRVIGTSA